MRSLSRVSCLQLIEQGIGLLQSVLQREGEEEGGGRREEGGGRRKEKGGREGGRREAGREGWREGGGGWDNRVNYMN